MFTFTIQTNTESFTVTNGAEVLSAVAQMGNEEAAGKFQMGYAIVEGGLEVTVQDILNDSDLEFLATGDYWVTLQNQAVANQAALAKTGDPEDMITDGDVVYGILEDLNMA